MKTMPLSRRSFDAAGEGAADVGHLPVEPEAETASPQAVVPHEHDAGVGDRLDERFDAARAADVFQVLALQTAGRVEQDVLAGLQAVGNVLQRRARAVTGRGAAALEVRQDPRPVEQGDVPEHRPIDLVLVRERAQLERRVQVRDDERGVQQRRVVGQEENPRPPLPPDGVQAADLDPVTEADEGPRDVSDKPGEDRHQRGEHATSGGCPENVLETGDRRKGAAGTPCGAPRRVAR